MSRNMNRREFMSLGAVAAAGRHGAEAPEPVAVGSEKRRRRKPMKMHLGTQRGPTTPEMLDFFKRHGVNNICGYPPHPGKRGYWKVEDLEKTRDLCQRHGISLDMVALPFLTSSHIDHEKRGAIMLADDPQRDRDIEHVQRMIEACARAGIPAFKYNMSLLGVLRTGTTAGRGGSRYSTWKLADARPNSPLTRAGRVDADAFWERITYFLDRVVPACNEHKVRAACHPHDPGVPPEGYQGIARVLGTPEGLRRFVSIQESPITG
jgi:mannonate dehydratase